MKSILCVTIAAMSLAGCDGQPVANGEHHQGRYQGVGIYPVSDMWSHMKVDPPANKQAATIDDDQHVIVVVDSTSGELRQCGDVSGYCVRSDPWSGGKAVLPAIVTAHAAELAADEATDMNTTADNITALDNAH